MRWRIPWEVRLYSTAGDTRPRLRRAGGCLHTSWPMLLNSSRAAAWPALQPPPSKSERTRIPLNARLKMRRIASARRSLSSLSGPHRINQRPACADSRPTTNRKKNPSRGFPCLIRLTGSTLRLPFLVWAADLSKTSTNFLIRQNPGTSPREEIAMLPVGCCKRPACVVRNIRSIPASVVHRTGGHHLDVAAPKTSGRTASAASNGMSVFRSCLRSRQFRVGIQAIRIFRIRDRAYRYRYHRSS